MHYKRIKKDGKIFVLSVRKTLSISLLWPRYMWLVLIVVLPPEGENGGYCSECVLLSVAIFVFMLVSTKTATEKRTHTLPYLTPSPLSETTQQ